ncbi:MAG: hypothetical protein PUC66_05260 [Erysipelotrichaceae bacterium]|nr:hypothetical protein [Erysipelotrichaceae bacterium]
MKSSFKQDAFIHCLRCQIVPDGNEDQQISSFRDFCLRYGFQNVILIFGGEEWNPGHMTKEEYIPWRNVMKKAKAAFEEAGLTVSLNPWMEIGHIDRGRTLKPGQDFQTMVDRYGKQNTLCACPADPEWRSYYLSLMKEYVQDIQPEVLWIEDDFRLHNHEPLDWGGCWCPLQMEEYNRQLGKEESREAFVENLSKGKPTKERKVWLDTNRNLMLSLANAIKESVQELGLGTSIGLMSSTPWMHAMEGRQWLRLQSALSPDGILINRIHLNAYQEHGSKIYAFEFNRISMVNRAFLGDDVLIFPELENSPYGRFVKDPAFTAFEVESALPLGLEGMTYNIADPVGSGTQEDLGYGEAIYALHPYLNAVKALRLLPSELRGITIPIDEDIVYHEEADNFLSLIPNAFDIVGYLSSLGFSYRLSQKKEFHHEIVVLFGQMATTFTDEELIALFQDNEVIVYGEAVLTLQERGLLSLIHAEVATRHPDKTATYCFEMAENGLMIRGMKQYKASVQRRTGDYVSIQYDHEVTPLSGVYNYAFERTGNGFVKGDHFLVVPYIPDHETSTSFLAPLRQSLYEIALPWQDISVLRTGIPGIYAYFYEQKDRDVLFFTNANYQAAKSFSFMSSVAFSSLEEIKHDGSRSPAPFVKEGSVFHTSLTINPLSTLCLIAKR